MPFLSHLKGRHLLPLNWASPPPLPQAGMREKPGQATIKSVKEEEKDDGGGEERGCIWLHMSWLQLKVKSECAIHVPSAFGGLTVNRTENSNTGHRHLNYVSCFWIFMFWFRQCLKKGWLCKESQKGDVALLRFIQLVVLCILRPSAIKQNIRVVE